MALDFPASPTVGQKYPSPAVTGVPVYTWDGEKWTTLGGAIGSTGASDAIPAPDTTAGAAGSSTLWARGDHSHPALTAPYVRYDASQSLTTPQQQQARQNIYAAPFDAMAYSGLQINGSFDVSQEKGNTATTTNGQYICDGWLANASGTMVIYMIPSNSPGSFNGLPNSLYAQTTTAQASLAAGDYWVASQKIEGYRVARLSWGTSSAQPITIGFWTLFHVPGVYSGVIRNGALNRCYAFTYTHAAADVAQYNVITIPGDTTGTWASDNTTGMQIVFTFAAGSGNVAPSANSWLAGGYIAAPGQVNGASATTNTFRITGVIVLPGNEAPSAARSPFVMRPYDQELVTCKRYFEIQRGTHTHYVNGVGSWGGDPVSFKTEKRANPTVAPLNATGANCSGPTIGSISQWGFNWSVSIISAGGAFISFDWNADARL